MNFARLFITRPVLAWVVNILIVMLGLVAWRQLPLRQYPQMEIPVITVETQIRGASADIIEAQLTRPLEDQFAGLPGLHHMVSESKNEESSIKLIFNQNRPIDSAAADVRDRLGRMADDLPQEATKPVITKTDTSVEPVVGVEVYSPNNAFSLVELSDYANRYIVPELKSIDGVAGVNSYGVNYEMHLIIDPQKLASYNLTFPDIANALHRQNLKRPAGRMTEGNKEYTILTLATLSNVQDFNNLVLTTTKEGKIIYLKDVGRAELSSGDERVRVWYNGQNAVGIFITAQATANPLTIAEGVRTRLREIEKMLPVGVKVDIGSDKTLYIKNSITEVYRAIAEAVVLVIAVTLIFLRSIRATLIPILTIPISLIGTFFIQYWLGFSINTLTLLAMVLAIGLVVDDAIVVLENIYRYLEKGLSPLKAAIKGTQEIQFSIIGMTLTLAAVYAPIALSSGMVGKLFTEFALTLAGAVLLSGVTALTLSPMMSSRLLRPHQEEVTGMFAPASRFIERTLHTCETGYGRALSRVLSKRLPVVLLAGIIGISGGFVAFYGLRTEMEPKGDQGMLKITAYPPYGATMEYLEPYARAIDEAMASIPEVEKRQTEVDLGGETSSIAFLKPWNARSRSCEALLPDLEKALQKVSGGMQVYARCPSKSLMGGSSERPLEIVLQTNQSHSALGRAAVSVIRLMHAHPGIKQANWNLPATGKEYIVTVNRERAAQLGLAPYDIAETLGFLRGHNATRFERLNKLFHVKVKIDESRIDSMQDLLNSLHLKTIDEERKEQKIVPLSDFSRLEDQYSVPEIMRYNGMRAVSFDAGVNPGYSLGGIYQELRGILDQSLPPGYRYLPTGELQRFLEESSTTALIFGLAIIFIFLIMAAQFESFRDPFIIMLTVPLALAGAVFTLWILPRGSMNIYTQIGMITLIGLITKHGILMVDFANDLRRQGEAKFSAIHKASLLRLRPILMTTFAMALGALPLAFASGAGAEARYQLGWSIVGGMSLGTFFTLFVVPVMYTFIAKENISPSSELVLENA